MTKIGLDVGDVRIGVAVSDPDERIALPHGAILRGGSAYDELLALVESEAANGLVVGLPRRMDGSLGMQAQATQQFIAGWHDFLSTAGVEAAPHIVWWDERLSSVAAERALNSGRERGKKRKAQSRTQIEQERRLIDATAAALILQGYLDYQRRQQPE